MPSSLPALLLLLLLLRPPAASARPSPSSPEDPAPPPTWRSFERLLDIAPGSNATGTSDLKRYLSRFGYLPAAEGGAINFTDSFDAALESALASYQSALGLPVTRRLDNLTLSQLTSPRCGVVDAAAAAAGIAGEGVRRFQFFPGRPRWDRPSPLKLTYSLSPTAAPDYLERSDVTAALRRAFTRWEQVIPVQFSEAASYDDADVRVAFYGGDHGDGEPFDGVLGVLAHAFSPESGKLHLDAAERWAVDFGKEPSEVAVDLESVATHEIGHVLGLAHSTDKEAVMYPSLSPRTKKADLRVDDVRGAQTLYGSNPNFRLSSLIESDTSSSGNQWMSRGWSENLVIVVIVILCI